MADLPKGRITGRFMHITADSEDGDTNPDFTPAAGSVIIAPMVPVMRFPGQTPPLVGLMEPIICPVIGGLMYRPGTDATDVGDPLTLGVTVPASDQPDGNPKVMLYEATFMFENRDIQPAPVAFMVPTDGVVDLSVPIPAAPEQPAIVAVSYVDASQAIAANAAAQGWATSASLKADNAAASATAAASSATAAQAAAAALQDTGWRNIATILDPETWSITTARLRRHGSLVTFTAQIKALKTNTSYTSLFIIPGGFRLSQLYVYLNSVSATNTLATVRDTALLTVEGSVAEGATLRIQSSWTTSDPFPAPAQYPGTPA